MRYEVIFRENDFTMMDRSYEEFETLEDACEYIEKMMEEDGIEEIVDDCLNMWTHYTKVYQDVYDDWYEDDISYLIRKIA